MTLYNPVISFHFPSYTFAGVLIKFDTILSPEQMRTHHHRPSGYWIVPSPQGSSVIFSLGRQLWRTKDTKGLPVFSYHPNVTFHNRCPFFKSICYPLPSQKDHEYKLQFFLIKSYFQWTMLAAHHCQNRGNRNIFKTAKLITVPRRIDVSVPGGADNQSPYILLLLVLRPCLPVFDSLACAILASSLPIF